MTSQLLNKLSADCENCFGLCCVALPYAKSADFPFDKDGGTPCQNLQSDYRCSIHNNLRNKGFRGCAVYECFGAGQKVSQVTYKGKDWRKDRDIATEMFDVFPIMQQLHEMLNYLYEALTIEVAKPIYNDIENAIEKIDDLTNLSPQAIKELHIPTYRAMVSELLHRVSELVREKVTVKKDKRQSKIGRGSDLLGANLKGEDLRGMNLRGALLIAANLRDANLSYSDLLGADLRDANLSGANLQGAIFLTQAQLNSAKGNNSTKIPASLSIPQHWTT